MMSRFRLAACLVALLLAAAASPSVCGPVLPGPAVAVASPGSGVLADAAPADGVATIFPVDNSVSVSTSLYVPSLYREIGDSSYLLKHSFAAELSSPVTLSGGATLSTWFATQEFDPSGHPYYALASGYAAGGGEPYIPLAIDVATSAFGAVVETNGSLTAAGAFEQCEPQYQHTSLVSGYHHLAAVSNDTDGTTSLYIDGTFRCSIARAASGNLTHIFGSAFYVDVNGTLLPENGFATRLFDTRIYQEALVGSQVAALPSLGAMLPQATVILRYNGTSGGVAEGVDVAEGHTLVTQGTSHFISHVAEGPSGNTVTVMVPNGDPNATYQVTPPATSGATERSSCVWSLMPFAGAGVGVLDSTNVTADDGLAVSQSDGALGKYGNGTFQAFAPSVNASTLNNVWQHFCAVYELNVLTLYVDTVPVASSAVENVDPTLGTIFGRPPGAAQPQTWLSLANYDYRHYANEPLTLGGVVAVYTQGRAGVEEPPEVLWGGTGPTELIDVSELGNSGLQSISVWISDPFFVVRSSIVKESFSIPGATIPFINLSPGTYDAEAIIVTVFVQVPNGVAWAEDDTGNYTLSLSGDGSIRNLAGAAHNEPLDIFTYEVDMRPCTETRADEGVRLESVEVNDSLFVLAWSVPLRYETLEIDFVGADSAASLLSNLNGSDADWTAGDSLGVWTAQRLSGCDATFTMQLPVDELVDRCSPLGVAYDGFTTWDYELNIRVTANGTAGPEVSNTAVRVSTGRPTALSASSVMLGGSNTAVIGTGVAPVLADDNTIPASLQWTVDLTVQEPYVLTAHGATASAALHPDVVVYRPDGAANCTGHDGDCVTRVELLGSVAECANPGGTLRLEMQPVCREDRPACNATGLAPDEVTFVFNATGDLCTTVSETVDLPVDWEPATVALYTTADRDDGGGESVTAFAEGDTVYARLFFPTGALGGATMVTSVLLQHFDNGEERLTDVMDAFELSPVSDTDGNSNADFSFVVDWHKLGFENSESGPAAILVAARFYTPDASTYYHGYGLLEPLRFLRVPTVAFEFADVDGAAQGSTVDPLPDGFDGAALLGNPPLNVTFNASLTSNVADSYNVTWKVADASTGALVATAGKEPLFSLLFALPGVYDVSLTVDGSAAGPGIEALVAAARARVRVNAAPAAVVNVTGDAAGTAPFTASFSAAGSTDDTGIVAYFWDFGNGRNTTTATGEVSYTYRAAGSYTASVVVADAFGLAAIAASGTAVVVNAPPTAAARLAPGQSQSGAVPFSVSVSGAGSSDADGPLAAYSWNWGDGSEPGTGSTATHTYAEASTYEITLTVTDSSGASDEAYLAVFALPEELVDPAPTPVLESAAFTDSLTAVVAVFANATDTAGMGFVPQACDAIIAASTVALLGTGPKCTWLDSSTLAVRLGSSPSISTADTLDTRSNVLRSADGTSLAAPRLSVQCNAPTNPPAVAAQLDAPLEVGSCSGAQLNGQGSTGNGGRRLEYSWSLVADADADALSTAERSALESALLGAPETGRLSLAAGVLPPSATFTFELSVTNWLGTSATARATVRKSGLQLPTVSVPGASSLVVRAGQPLSVAAVASVAQCDGDDALASRLTYQWSQLLSAAAAPSGSAAASAAIDGPLLPVSVTALVKRRLELAAGVVQPGFVYGFAVSCCLFYGNATLPEGCTDAAFAVEAPRAELRAVIAGGNRLVSRAAGTTFTLDGSGSGDPDDDAATLTYAWTCTRQADGAACGISLAAQAELEIASSSLGETAAGNAYVFSLRVSSAVGSRTSPAASVRISTTPDVVPEVAIQPLEDEKQSPASRLALRGLPPPVSASVGGAYTFLWTCTSNNYDLSADGATLTGTASRNLVIPGGRLAGGASYTFQLAVTDAGTGKSGVAAAEVVTNAAPTSGSCRSEPEAGEAFVTEFLFLCEDWTDDADDLPLRYSFRAVDGSGREQTLSAFQTANELRTSSLGPRNYTVRAYVEDVYGARAVDEFEVSVSEPALAEDEDVSDFAADVVDSTVSEAAASGDAEAFAQGLFAVTELIAADADDTGTGGGGGGGDDNATAEATAKNTEIRRTLLTGLRAVTNTSAGAVQTAESLTQQAQMISSIASEPTEMDEEVRDQAVSFIADTLAAGSDGSLDADSVDSISSAALSTISSVVASDAAEATEDEAGGGADAVEARRSLALSVSETIQSISRLSAGAQVPGEERKVLRSGSLRLYSQVDYAQQYAGGEIASETADSGFSLPASLFDGAGSGAGEDDAVTSSYYINTENIFSWADADGDQPPSSPLVSLSFFGETGDEVGVTGLSEPIRVTLPRLTPAEYAENERPACRFFDETAGAWSSDGCELDEASSNANVTVCLCTHLTSFSSATEEFTPEVTAFNADDINRLTWENLTEHPAPLITVAACTLVFLAVLPLARRRDAELKRRVQVLASYRDGESVDDLVERMRAQRLESGVARKMLAEDEEGKGEKDRTGDASGDAERAGGSKLRRASTTIRKRMKTDHMWFSVALREPTDNFTSVQRCTIVYSIVLGTLAFNSFFFGPDQRLGAMFLISFLSGLAIIPATVVFATLFQRAGDDPAVAVREARRRYAEHVRQRDAKLLPAPAGTGGAGAGAASSSSACASPRSPRSSAESGGAVEMQRLRGRGADPIMDAPEADSAAAPVEDKAGPGLGALEQPGEADKGEAARKPSPARLYCEEDEDDGKPEAANGAGEETDRRSRLRRACDFRLPAWFVRVGYACVFLYVATCIFIILVMGLKFDEEEEEAEADADATSGEGAGNEIFGAPISVSSLWILSSFLSMLQDIVLNQPLGIVLSTLASVFIGTDVIANMLCCQLM